MPINKSNSFNDYSRTEKRKFGRLNGESTKRLKPSICKISPRSQTENKNKPITTIECLPNELFYQIFSYLTDDDVFSSWDFHSSNHRYDQLIRNRVSINFRSICRSLFIKIINNRIEFINCRIIRKIYLFNSDQTPGLINLFFSKLSISDFPNLGTLVLDQPEQNDLIKLMKYFSTLEHLAIDITRSVRMPPVVYDDLYSSVLSSPKSAFKSLQIRDDPDEPIQISKGIYLPYLNSLTLGPITIDHVQKIFRSANELRHFKFYLHSDLRNYQIEPYCQTKITYLEIESPHADFNLVKHILCQTNKLKSLKLICRVTNGLIWKMFINEFLPNLLDFRFKFHLYEQNIDYHQYQDNWWRNEKKWIVAVHPLFSSIYTIPFIEERLTLNSRMIFRREDKTRLNRFDEYKNIRRLTVRLKPFELQLCQTDQIYFPNVEYLTLIDFKYSPKHIAHLCNLINFTNIQHITIDDRLSAKTFLLIVQQMPKLNSISGNDISFSKITNKFQNEQVNTFLRSKIKRLLISSSHACRSIRYLSQLFVVFSNIYHLTLTIKYSTEIFPWLNNMFNLRSATVFCRYGSFIDLVNSPTYCNVFERLTYELRSHQHLRLWIE